MIPDPKTLQQAILTFSDPAQAHDYAVAQRWPGGVECPKCGSKDVLYMERYRRWKCRGKHASPQFTLKTGTVMEDSPIPLGKWLIAMWMLANCKNGISSYEVAKSVGVSQHSCWFMMHRIREAMREDEIAPMGSADGGEVEADETYVGPDSRKMHKSRKRKLAAQRGEYSWSTWSGVTPGKTAVQGILDREGRRVRATVIRNTRRDVLQEEILKNVVRGSRLYTDDHPSYMGLGGQYIHEVIAHTREYVRERVSTQGIENFWSLLKRGLRGSYVSVEPFHLDRYVTEQVFRFNNRATKDNKVNDADRMTLVASQVAGKRLTYKGLTGKGDLPEAAS